MALFQGYRNLNKPGYFSIRQSGRVIDHSKSLKMYDCHFHIGEKGRLRVIRDRRKNVHAWVAGEVYENGEFNVDGMHELYYDPYYTQKFHSLLTGEVVNGAAFVIFKDNRCYVNEIR